MKKKLILLILLFAIAIFGFSSSSKISYASEDKIQLSVETFTIESKVFDNKPINDPILKFVDKNNNQVELLENDYSIKYYYSGIGVFDTKPLVVNTYTAELIVTNEKYVCANKTQNFEITKAEGFQISVNDVTICEGMELEKPTFNINGVCYENLKSTFYLKIDNTETKFEDISPLNLSHGIYDLILKLDTIYPNYKFIEIENGKYIVNKKNLSFDNNEIEITLSKQLGINDNVTLNFEKCENNNIFSEKFEIGLIFNLLLKNQNDVESLKNYTCKIKFEVKNDSKFKIYGIKENAKENISYAYNNGYLVFEINDDYEHFAFVYERTKVTLIAVSLILIIISFVELFFAIKVFKLKNKYTLSVCAPNYLLVFFDDLDLGIFILSLWIFVCSTLLLLYCIKKPKLKKDENKLDKVILNNEENDEITKEDEELFCFISKKKKEIEYDIEEIIE